jgi:hypothetical protein
VYVLERHIPQKQVRLRCLLRVLQHKQRRKVDMYSSSLWRCSGTSEMSRQVCLLCKGNNRNARNDLLLRVPVCVL